VTVLLSDARRLPPDSQEDLRRRVVAAVNNGMSQRQAAEVFGVSRRSVGLWSRLHRVAGPDALRANRRGRLPGVQHALPRRTQAELLQEMVAGPPERVGIDGALWSRRALTALILARTGCRVSATTANRYLARWGIAPPARADTPPTLRGGQPVFERGRSSARSRMWTLAWERPVPRFAGSELVPGPGTFAAGPPPGRLGPPPPFLEALIAESGRGELLFQLAHLPYRTADLVDFGERLVRCLGPGVHLALRNWPTEHASALHTWAADTGPGFCLTPWWPAAIPPLPRAGAELPRRSEPR
jgi:transposase